MICNVYWKNRKRTPEPWVPEDDHELSRLLSRDMRVIGFIRDGIQVEFDDYDLEYFQNRFEQLEFSR
jgi:hypothetical protein